MNIINEIKKLLGVQELDPTVEAMRILRDAHNSREAIRYYNGLYDYKNLGNPEAEAKRIITMMQNNFAEYQKQNPKIMPDVRIKLEQLKRRAFQGKQVGDNAMAQDFIFLETQLGMEQIDIAEPCSEITYDTAKAVNLIEFDLYGTPKKEYQAVLQGLQAKGSLDAVVNNIEKIKDYDEKVKTPYTNTRGESYLASDLFGRNQFEKTLAQIGFMRQEELQKFDAIKEFRDFAISQETLINENRQPGPSEQKQQQIIEQYLRQTNDASKLLELYEDMSFKAGAGRHDMALAEENSQSETVKKIYQNLQDAVGARLQNVFLQADPKTQNQLVDEMKVYCEDCIDLERHFEGFDNETAKVNRAAFQNSHFAVDDLRTAFRREIFQQKNDDMTR